MFLCDLKIRNHLKIKEDENQIYIAPHQLLSKYIAHYTISYPIKMKNNNENSDELILIPDSSGCIVYTFENNDFSSSLWGATTKTVKVKKDSNLEIVRFFIEFMPGGLHAITGINQSEFCDIKAPVEEIDKCLSSSLVHAMEIANNIDDMITAVNMILLKAMQKNWSQHTIIDSALDRIRYKNGIITIKELSSNEYISERHLNRLFNEHIGINAKLFLRLVRINQSMSLLKKTGYESNINIAQTLGYFDQAHFIHDFKQICGVTPNSFTKNMSDFYNEPFKY